MAVGAMLVVRQRAPAGGYLADSGRGAGVFGVLGTVVAVLLALVIFPALQTYCSAVFASMGARWWRRLTSVKPWGSSRNTHRIASRA
ncbi:MAG: hypothetical protein ACRDWI_04090 [Jiangellaceae bacterium]